MTHRSKRGNTQDYTHVFMLKLGSSKHPCIIIESGLLGCVLLYLLCGDYDGLNNVFAHMQTHNSTQHYTQ